MKHLAIIADGNRRWAVANDLPKRSGYLQGLVTIENCCDWAINNNVEFITVYCFSTENWRREKNEVNMLMDLARWYFENAKDWYVNRSIKVRFLGRRDRCDDDLRVKMQKMEEATVDCSNLTLTICFDYGGRDEIIRAIQAGAKTEEEITAMLTSATPEPDMILRTGGDVRLSNFLLWQSAYAELMFIDTLFPDLNADILDSVLKEYKVRKRNFGR